MRGTWKRLRRLWSRRATTVDGAKAIESVRQIRAENVEAEFNRARNVPGGY